MTHGTHMANRRNFSNTIYGIARNPDTGVTNRLISRKASFSGSDYNRRKSHARWIPPTEYSMQSAVSVEPNGSCIITNKKTGAFQVGLEGVLQTMVSNNQSFWNANLANKPDFGTTFPAGLKAQAQNKAWSSLKNQKVNLGQAWAERAQTASLVSNNLARMVSGLRRLRRNPAVLKDIARGANRIVKDLPNWWIEVVFGWKPLVSDIHGAIQELESRNSESSGYRVTAIGKAHRIGKFEGTLGLSSLATRATVQAEMFHGCKCRIDAVPSSDAFIKAASLGLTNPLSLAWELMPWSFAIDWCFPLGQYFDLLDAPLGWDILGMSTSSFSRQSMRRVGLSASDNSWRCSTSFTSHMRNVSLSRSNDVVMPWSIAPKFKDPFSSKQRVGTMLSLLGQLIHKGPYGSLH